MRYTKGPWQVAHSLKQYGAYTIRPWAQVDRQYRLYDRPPNLPIREIRRNNGRIIAKAPDLYEGVKALVRAWTDFRPELLDEMAELINIIREIENDETYKKESITDNG